MATRFGATPARLYATKVRWLMGGLLSLVVVLVGVIVCIITTLPSNVTATVPAGSVASPSPQRTITVAFATKRLEAGSRIVREDFRMEPLPVGLAPLDGVSEADLHGAEGSYLTTLLAPGVPLLRSNISAQAPSSALPIPKGFRAATIVVDQREGVDGFPEPNARVDVLWSYTERGAPKVATLIHFAKVLSVAGNSSPRGRTPLSGPVPVTLLVSKVDAKRIELARTVGKLSLSLLGQDSIEDDTDPGAVGIPQLTNEPAPEEAAPEYSGIAMLTDPITGRQMRFVSDGKRWSRDTRF